MPTHFHPAANVTVELSGGRVTGQRLSVPFDGKPAEVLAFRGMRYAEAPVDERRFAPPEPVAHWSDVRDATLPGPLAPQAPSRLRGAMGDIEAPQSEDCLHLTVWTPACDRGLRPVLVWIHGGAWQSGGAALDWYDGAHLARRGDVVVVAINYRLAALGWLYVPGEVVNPGLLDQECALRWVIDNITAFGGDPTRITAMGQSSGAMSIAALLARGAPIHRAILQSPAPASAFRSAAQAAELSARLMQVCGVSSVEEARHLPTAALLMAQGNPRLLETLRAERAHRSLFCPVLDGSQLPEDLDGLLSIATSRADVLIGYTLNELAAWSGGRHDAASDAASERLFGIPAGQWAEAAMRHGRDAWLYRFDLAPNSRFGACHAIELPFVFGTLSAFSDAPMMQGLDLGTASAYVEAVQQPWLRFIRGESPGWPQAPAIRSLP